MPNIKVDLSNILPPSWAGNNFVSERGYPIVYREGRWRPRHVVVAEKALGRGLRKGEEVHHINGDKKDYSNSNLLICTGAYHYELHRRCLRVFGTWHLPGIGEKANQEIERKFAEEDARVRIA